MKLSKRASGIIAGIILLGLGIGIGVMVTQQSAPADVLADPAQAQAVIDPNRADEKPEVNVTDARQPVEAESSSIEEANTQDLADTASASIDEASLTADQAKAVAEAALPNASVVKVERSVENGVVIYRIELDNGQAVKVDTANGSILYIELMGDELEDEAKVQAAAQDDLGITAEEAKEIAEKAFEGATAVELELERENGGLVYEVELDNGFEVEINADTGDVLEIEQDDD